MNFITEIRGRKVTSSDIDEVRSIIAEHRNQSRSYISKKLAERWKWFQPNGNLKDRACRDILLALEKRDFIKLPPSRRMINHQNGNYHFSKPPSEIDSTPLFGAIDQLKPLICKMVSRTSLEPMWNYLVNRYHYLGYKILVGSNLKYLVFSENRFVAALGWNSAVWKLADRDKAIGWSADQKKKYLHRVSNNSRFLIFPWVTSPGLASYLLSKCVRTLNSDWMKVYNYRLWLLESFVQTDMYNATSYRAANWIHVGRTKGFKKQGNTFKFDGQTKEVFLYPLKRDFRKKIGCDSKSLPPLDHKYLLSVEKTFQRGGDKMILRHPGWDPEVLPPLNLDESDVDKLSDEFEQFHQLFKDAFRRVEQIDLSQCYIQGLMSPLKRKSMEPIALGFMGPERVRSLQHFVSSGKWDLDILSDIHREEAAKTLADPDGIFNIDATEIPKKGKESVGVARQYCGRLGKRENCQSGVFLGYSSPKGYGLLDRRLYLPEIWFTKEYEERWKKCKIPEDVIFKTKPQLAAEMIKDIQESVLFPAKWITCDCAYGNSHEFLDNLPEGLNYLADVPCNTLVWLTRPETAIPPYSGRGRRPKIEKLKEGEPKPIKVKEIAKDSNLDWKLHILDEGAKGPIVAKMARLRVIESRDFLPGKERWLLIRHCPDSNETKYFLSDASIDAPFDEMCRVCILRWPIEQCFKEGKSEIGMDHYEHRSWPAWHRHMTFVFLAQLFLLRFRHTLKKKPLL